MNVIDGIANRKTLTFFRMGVSSLLIPRSRFITHVQSVCPLCNEHEEDEIHFYYLVLYTMTYARNIYVFQKMYLQTMPYLK